MANTNFQFAKPGLNSVGSYQMGGIPYASANIPVLGASVFELEFPTVTSFVTITNSHSGVESQLRVGFSALGITDNNHFFILENGESYTADFRVRSIFIAGSAAGSGFEAGATASVIAGLTQIETEHLPTNWSASDGTGLFNGTGIAGQGLGGI